MRKLCAIGIVATATALFALPALSGGHSSTSATPCTKTFSLATGENDGTGDNIARAMASSSPTDVWLAGSFFNPTTGLNQTLIEHSINGTTFTILPSPNVAGDSNVLTGVVDLSPTNVWFVGDSVKDSGGNFVSSSTLILHFNGQKLSIVPSPNLINPSAINHNPNDSLFAIAALSATNIVAVGNWVDNATGRPHTLAEQWNGTKWVLQSNTPNPGVNGNSFFSVDPLAGPTPTFFFGGAATNQSFNQGAILFKRSESPSETYKPFPIGTDLGGATDAVKYVVAKSATDIWIAVDHTNQNGVPTPLVTHWDGKKWTVVPHSGVYEKPSTVLLVLALGGGPAVYAGGSSKVQSFQDPTLILKFTPTGVAPVPAPSPGTAEDILYGGTSVKTSSGSDIWFAGDYQSHGGPRRVLIVRACGL